MNKENKKFLLGIGTIFTALFIALACEIAYGWRMLYLITMLSIASLSSVTTVELLNRLEERRGKINDSIN